MGAEDGHERPIEAVFSGDGAADAAKAADEAIRDTQPEGAEIEATLDEFEVRAIARAERMEALLGAVEAAVDAAVTAAGQHGAGVDVRAEGDRKPAPKDPD